MVLARIRFTCRRAGYGNGLGFDFARNLTIIDRLRWFPSPNIRGVPTCSTATSPQGRVEGDRPPMSPPARPAPTRPPRPNSTGAECQTVSGWAVEARSRTGGRTVVVLLPAVVRRVDVHVGAPITDDSDHVDHRDGAPRPDDQCRTCPGPGERDASRLF
jgi:hypothetical protein